MLRFLNFIFIIHSIFHLIISDNLSMRNQCQSGWHYLSDKKTCIIFATSQAGDVSWYDSYKACETNSAQVLTLFNSNKFQLVQKLFNELKYHNQLYLDLIQRGAWIGKAKWSKNDLCDSGSTTIEDLYFNCIVLTIHRNNQSLCLKRVSCRENHPFICQNRAMTENELIESTMTRFTWWKCIIIIWCVVDAVSSKPKPDNSENENLQNYLNQFEFNISQELLTDDAQSLASSENKITLTGWMYIIGAGFLTLLMMCICCAACICVFKMIINRRSRQNSIQSHGSLESTYSAESR